MPTLLAFISLFGTKATDIVSKEHPSRQVASSADNGPAQIQARGVQVHGMRLLELTERDSSVMKVSEIDEFSIFDPVLNAFRILGQLFNIGVSGEVAVVPESSFPDTLVNKAAEDSSDLLLLPWSETGTLGERQTISNNNVKNKLASDVYSSFIAHTLNTVRCNAAVFINKGFSGTIKQRPALHRSASSMSIRSNHEHIMSASQMNRNHHIFLPYFGVSADDHTALRLVLQLAENPEVTATIVHYASADAIEKDGVTHTVVVPKDVSDHSPATRSGAITSASEPSENHATFFDTLQRSLPEALAKRVVFDTKSSADPLGDALQQAQAEVAQDPRNGGDIVVVGRHVQQFRQARSANDCLGAAAQTMAESGIRASLLVVQARGRGLE